MTLSTCRLLPLVILVFVVSACDLQPPWQYDELTFEKTPYPGEHLRTDGYWYSPYSSTDGDTLYDIHFFYRNGIVRYGGAGPSLSELETDALENGEPPRSWWGLFTISGDQIEFERWYPGEYETAYIRSGRILSDTTFIITESRRSRGGDIQEKNEYYYFRAFTPKPDSTNRYID